MKRYLILLQTNTYFNVSGLPVLASPLARLNDLIDGVKGISMSTNAVRTGAVTSCQIARSVCKPVDDLLGKGTGYSSQGYYPQYRPAVYTTPQAVIPPGVFGLDQGTLMSELKGV